MPKVLFRKKSIERIIREAEDGTTDGHHKTHLNKVLSVRDLTFMGIAAVVGAGVFSTIGTAAFNGGPGISLLFVITAITCGFSALCYAEFASRVPIAGSAYTYAYVSFGELIAWIIGWALILEYAIGNIVVAISWSSYFNNLLEAIGVHLPGWLTVDPVTAKTAFEATQKSIGEGAAITSGMQAILDAWNSAPMMFGTKMFVNLPAFIIVCFIAVLTYIGIKESKNSANSMVIFKVAVIVFVIVLGFFYVQPSHWSPFMPNGFEGVLKGVSAVFYAYIGFDAISTTAEECRNPQRDLPKGMIYSLLICTVLYILIALVLTGMVHYSELNVNDPLAFIFERVGQQWISYMIAISAVVATTSVLLVFQLGQPRIWMSMSRDGLLPKAFGKVHPKYQTPYFSTIITGILVAVPSLFMQSSLMTDLTSIGTLFAFVLVSGGVLLLPKLAPGQNRAFRLPYINGKFIVPVLYALFLYTFWGRIGSALQNFSSNSLQEILFLIYVLVATILTILSFLKSYSLIPILGVLFCAYLLIEIPAVSWEWFFVWMAVGLAIYFVYGYHNSRLSVVSIVKNRWEQLAGNYTKDKALRDRLFAEIKKSYSSAGRHYHTLQHIAALLEQSNQYGSRLADKEVVDLAIIYHDIVYEVNRKDNEQRSAQLAMERLTALGVPAEKREMVKTFIEATQTHKVPANSTGTADMEFFLDLDMSILAAGWEDYKKYMKNIRQEYKTVSAEFNEGRTKFLQQLIDSNHIFYTPEFRTNGETRARRNMAEEIKYYQ